MGWRTCGCQALLPCAYCCNGRLPPAVCRESRKLNKFRPMGIGKNPALQRSQIQQAQSAGVWIHVWRDAPHRGIPAPSCRFPLFCVYATHPTRTGVTKAVSAPLPEVPRVRQHPTACGETVNSIETSRRPIIHIRRQSGSPSQVVQNWFPKSKAGRRPKSPETNYIETHSQITVGISRNHQ